jgi:FkbM family methyltransferase
MLLNLDELIKKYDIRITGVIHAGAHLAEEIDDYYRLGAPPVMWIDPIKENFEFIKKKIRLGHFGGRYHNNFVVRGLLYDEEDVELDFHITNYDGMSSSIFEFGTHPQFSPDTVFERTEPMKTTTLDSLYKTFSTEPWNFLNMDLQGAELKALQGAQEMLPHIDYVYTEVNKDEVYIGCAKIWELDEFLFNFGFARVETDWVGDQGWGDAFYIKAREPDAAS